MQISQNAYEQSFDIAITDTLGAFKFENIQYDSIYLIFSHLNFGTVAIPFSKSAWDKKTLFIKLEKNIFALPEVSVVNKNKGVRIIGDTIRFDLSVLRTGNEKDLQKLLKSLPGIEISETGEIKFNGKKIEKILLSGKDVIRNQFSLANSLIQPEALSTIEVFSPTDIAEEQPQYLNLVMATPRTIIVNAIATVATKNRHEVEASLLDMADKDFNYFGALRSKSTEKQAITTADQLRSNDFDCYLLHQQYDLLVAQDLNFTISENQAPEKRQDHAALANFNVAKNQLETSLFVQSHMLNTSTSSSSRYLSLLENKFIRSSDSKTNLNDSNLKTYFKHKNKIANLLYVFTSLDINLENNTLHTKGNSIFTDEVSNFEVNKKNKRSDVILLAEIKSSLDSGSFVSAYFTLENKNHDTKYGILDEYPIYNFGSPSSLNSYMLSGDIDRSKQRSVLALQFKKKLNFTELTVGSTFSFSNYEENGRTPTDHLAPPLNIKSRYEHQSYLYYIAFKKKY